MPLLTVRDIIQALSAYNPDTPVLREDADYAAMAITSVSLTEIRIENGELAYPPLAKTYDPEWHAEEDRNAGIVRMPAILFS